VHSKNVALFCLISLVGIPLAAPAASITYDFTGTISSVSGTYSAGGNAVGSAVTGTFTIDFAAENSLQSSGTIGSMTSAWASETYGGQNFNNAPLPTASVFTMTIDSAGNSYDTGPIGAEGYGSFINGYVAGASNSINEYVGVEQQFISADGSYVKTLLNLDGGIGTNAGSFPYDANGLPVFSNAIDSTGEIVTNVAGAGVGGGALEFNIQSITPVPLPATVWLMLSGVVGLGVLTRRRVA